ncbi:MAG: hypothetical protein WC980_09165 [Candidatus Brocadiia bacterium]
MSKRIFIYPVLLLCIISICCSSSGAKPATNIGALAQEPLSLECFDEAIEGSPLKNGMVRVKCTWYDLFYQTEIQPASIKVKNTGRLYFISSGGAPAVALHEDSSRNFALIYDVKSIAENLITLNLKGTLSYVKENFFVESLWEGTVKNGEEQAFSKVFTDPISKENRLLLIIIKANNKNDSTDPVDEYRKMHPFLKEPDKSKEQPK